MKKSKSVGVENIPEKLVQIGDETMIDVSTQISNSLWRTREWPTTSSESLIVTRPPYNWKPAALPEL